MPERLVLVTGATSGIGRATALELAARGLTILIHGRDVWKCNAVVAEITQMGGTARSYVSDFTSLASVRGMCAEIRRQESRIDLLVNNAGTGFVPGNPATDDGYDPIMQVNLIAPLLIIKSLENLLREARPSFVINVASAGQFPFGRPPTLTLQGNPGVAYGRSKVGLIMVTRLLAREIAPADTSFVAVNPGNLLKTALSNRLLDLCPWPIRVILQRKARRAPVVSDVASSIGDLCDNPSVCDTGSFLSLYGSAKTHPQVNDELMSRSVLDLVHQVIEPFTETLPEIEPVA